MTESERTLWTDRSGNREIHCVMRSCCTGAELQILISAAPGDEPAVALRELYPTKSDLYERARQLAAHYRDEGARRRTP
jgi:hypothetical protein